ncbi:MAG: CrcB family protein [Microcella sp.]|uniref:fluoride efflux transporter FluC n=1 Tax=Microcella sp. TaxID=1913979 RepID=UPI0024C88056|nr:CrcB family protein [Microcella sp.]UYN82909.1 MAG: CrcB family protein [Microcella sp.]
MLGLLVAALWPPVPSWVRVGLGPGILGSFTTFSALAISVVALARSGEVLVALLSIVLSIGFGMLSAWAGLALGARLNPRQTPEFKEVDEWPPSCCSPSPWAEPSAPCCVNSRR